MVVESCTSGQTSACFLHKFCILTGVTVCGLLQEQTISDKFASLSEALQVAESKAREATEMRKQVALEMARRQKLAKDEQMRKLAMQARMERGGAAAAAAVGGAGGLAGRLDAGAGATAGGGVYPGPPQVPAAGAAGHSDRSPSPGSSDEEDRRRGGRGDRRGRQEHEETAQVSLRAGAAGAGCGLSQACCGTL